MCAGGWGRLLCINPRGSSPSFPDPRPPPCSPKGSDFSVQRQQGLPGASEQRPPKDHRRTRPPGPAAPRSRRHTSARATHSPERPLPRSATWHAPYPAPSAPLRSAPAAPAAARTPPGLPGPPRRRPTAPPPARSLRSRPSVGGPPGHAPASRQPRGWGTPAQPHLPLLRRHQARLRPPPAYHRQGRASRPRLRRNRSPQPLWRWEALAGSTFPVFLWR